MIRIRGEEEPDEPEEEAEPSPRASIPAVGEPDRTFEYSVARISIDDLAGGEGLAKRLNDASAEGWDLVSIVDAGEARALVMRRRRRPQHEGGQVGFTAPRRG
ncbi:MAG: hypothetical protein ACREPA_06635 [Candidatus Dormibacteraceae bacterium]